MILVDTSVWIDYFRGAITKETELLDRLLRVEPLVIGDLMVVEVLLGFEQDEDYLAAQRLQTSLLVIELGGEETAAQAEINLEALASLGVPVRKTINAVIATRCIEYGLPLLHSDRGFDPFAEHLGLQVVT